MVLSSWSPWERSEAQRGDVQLHSLQSCLSGEAQAAPGEGCSLPLRELGFPELLEKPVREALIPSQNLHNDCSLEQELLLYQCGPCPGWSSGTPALMGG